jgi:hypothetical protein
VKSSNKSENIVVVGNGIAAKCVVYFLNREGFNNITLIADDIKAPGCSTRTTSTNCLRGTEKGVSDLGDLILKSYADFEDFYDEHQPDGISKSIETHTTPISSSKLDKWKRRYSVYTEKSRFCYFTKEFSQKLYSVDNEAYFIFPELFFKWFDKKLSFKLIEGFVEKVQEKSVLLKSSETVEFDKLILCTSFLTKDFSDIVREDIKISLKKSKPVPGTYLSFPITSFDDAKIDLTRDYCFRIDDIHMLVRPTAGDVLIGSTSKSNVLDYSHDQEAMMEMFERLSLYLEGVLCLPDFSKGQLITGIRHKGRARRPFWGEINEDIYAVWGLYKNAFTFAFTAGEEIADLIKK